MPASKVMRTACGFHSGLSAALATCRSTNRRRMKVASPAAPPPGLSALSAMTTRPGCATSAASIASSMPSQGVLSCARSTASIGEAARRSASNSSHRVSQASRVVVPPSWALATKPPIKVQPSSRARWRSAHSGPANKTIWSRWVPAEK